jgi:glycosyltransferase involved in cell wall biosynthesis
MGIESAPRVSVIIDTYNCGHLVHRAIDSVLAQTYPRSLLDIFVIDDGSTDNTSAVVERYTSPVRYVRKPNGGQASALNEGFRKARGDILCLLDGDDYFHPKKVMSVVDVFDRRPKAGLVYNKFDIVTDDGTSIKRDCPEVMAEGDLEDLTLLGYSYGCVTSAISLRRSVVGDIEIPEEPFHVSADYFLGNILPLLTEVGAVHESLSAWVSHGTNALLSNPGGSSPELNRQHRAAIFDYAQTNLNKHFLTYLGRAGMGEALVSPMHPRSRLNCWRNETLQIARARVDGRLKLRAQAKLTAALLPSTQFARLTKRRPAGHSTPADPAGR